MMHLKAMTLSFNTSVRPNISISRIALSEGSRKEVPTKTLYALILKLGFVLLTAG